MKRSPEIYPGEIYHATKEPEPTPRSIGFVFSGQGLPSRAAMHRHIDNLMSINPDVTRRNIGLMEEASEIPLSRYIVQRNETALGRTDVMQAMIHGAHLTAIELLQPMLSDPKQTRITAGHSAGEIAAQVAAGFLTPEDSARVIAERGRLMHEESIKKPGALFIPLGLSKKEAQDVIEQTKRDLFFAHYFLSSSIAKSDRWEILQEASKSLGISPKDFELLLKRRRHVIGLALSNEPTSQVIGGTKEAVAIAKQIVKKTGSVRVIDVDAEGAFHTKLMESAREKLGEFYRDISMQAPNFPIVLNDGTETMNPEVVRETHIHTMSNPVDWTLAMERFRDIDVIVTIGPGGQVPGVNKRNGLNENLVNVVDLLQTR